jgi:tetratricopeptide (TPR) repeat protein
MNLASLYQDLGRYEQAEPLLKRSLAIREKALGPDHRDVAESLNNVASLHQAQGRYAQAEPLLKRSLAICEKALGPDHIYVAQVLHNLSHLLGEQKRFAEADPLYARALDIRAKSLGDSHPDTIATMEERTQALRMMGLEDKAKDLESRLRAAREKAANEQPQKE